jgi:phenylacetate-CoA ligase
MLQPDLEALDREALARLQLEGMRRTLARVLRNPAWRQRLGGVEVGDLRSVDDWGRLPFLTKEALRDAYPYALACGGAEGYRRVHMSSGTTGNPILNPYTAADVAQWSEVMARCYTVAGVTREDVIQITPSFGLFTGGFGFHYGAERLGAMVVPIGAGRTLLQLKLMRDLGVTVLPAIATYPLRLIEVAHEERFDLASLRLRVAILGSEMWSDELRARIDRELGVTSYDIMGMTETGGPGSASTARRGPGCTSGRTTTTSRSSTRRRAPGGPTVPRASSSSRPSRARGCRWCATGPTTSRASWRARGATAGAPCCVSTGCAAAPTTWSSTRA